MAIITEADGPRDQVIEIQRSVLQDISIDIKATALALGIPSSLVTGSELRPRSNNPLVLDYVRINRWNPVIIGKHILVKPVESRVKAAVSYAARLSEPVLRTAKSTFFLL